MRLFRVRPHPDGGATSSLISTLQSTRAFEQVCPRTEDLDTRGDSVAYIWDMTLRLRLEGSSSITLARNAQSEADRP